MKFSRTARCWLCLLLPALLTSAHALTLDVKAVKLTTDQQASLKRHLAESLPALTFDWNSLAASSTFTATSTPGKRQPLTVTMDTVPALTAAGVCRSEQHHFFLEATTGNAKIRWQESQELTGLQAWTPQGGDCTQVSSAISVDKSLSDADFLFLSWERDALRSRAAGVIGGSDCARVRFCEVTLRRINRVRQENPSRVLTKLTFSPLKPGPSCLYVMEVSFVGPLEKLEPLGASCPLP